IAVVARDEHRGGHRQDDDEQRTPHAEPLDLEPADALEREPERLSAGARAPSADALVVDRGHEELQLRVVARDDTDAVARLEEPATRFRRRLDRLIDAAAGKHGKRGEERGAADHLPSIRRARAADPSSPGSR